MKKGLFLILSLLLGLAAHSQSLTDNLVIYYPFNGNAIDASGNNNDGALFGAPTPDVDRYGNANSAFHFDGVDDYIQIPAVIDLNTPTWTYLIEFKLDSLPSVNNNTDLLVDNTTFNSYIYLEAQSATGGQPNEIRSYSYGNYLNTNFIVEQDTWYQVAMTSEQGSIKMYVNGNEVASSASYNFGTGIPTYYTIYKKLGFWNQWGNGTLDEIRFYDKALSQSEINQLYTTPTPVGTIEHNFDTELTVFPNPTTGQTTIDLGTVSPSINTKTLGADGKIISTQTFQNSSQLDLSIEGAAGLYFIEILTSENEKAIIKIIKE